MTSTASRTLLPWRWSLLMLAGAWFFGTTTAVGQLHWEQTEIALAPASGDKVAKAQYAFINAGKTDIAIKSLKNSCGCTASSANQKVYKPGEKGVIDVVFTIGDFRGLQRKVIIVETNAPTNPKTILLLAVQVPSLAQFEPSNLEWKIGSEATVQKLQLKLMDQTSAHLRDIKSTSSVLSINQKQISPKLYEITVTPTSTEAPVSALITATLDDNSVTSISLPVRIRR